jgi:hypothetical protein
MYNDFLFSLGLTVVDLMVSKLAVSALSMVFLAAGALGSMNQTIPLVSLIVSWLTSERQANSCSYPRSILVAQSTQEYQRRGLEAAHDSPMPNMHAPFTQPCLRQTNR